MKNQELATRVVERQTAAFLFYKRAVLVFFVCVVLIWSPFFCGAAIHNKYIYPFGIYRRLRNPVASAGCRQYGRRSTVANAHMPYLASACNALPW